MNPLGISQMKIFQGLPQEGIAAIEKIAEEISYCYDTELAFDGTESKYVYLLREGRTELVTPHPKTGKKVVIASKKPGETMGFSSLIEPYQMSFTIRCLTDCKLYRIPKARLLQELKRRPDLFEAVRHRIAQHVFPSVKKALDTLQKDSTQGGWYPEEGDIEVSAPEEGDIL